LGLTIMGTDFGDVLVEMLGTSSGWRQGEWSHLWRRSYAGGMVSMGGGQEELSGEMDRVGSTGVGSPDTTPALQKDP
jgi:hypothetical protein